MSTRWMTSAAVHRELTQGFSVAALRANVSSTAFARPLSVTPSARRPRRSRGRGGGRRRRRGRRRSRCSRWRRPRPPRRGSASALGRHVQRDVVRSRVRPVVRRVRVVAELDPAFERRDQLAVLHDAGRLATEGEPGHRVVEATDTRLPWRRPGRRRTPVARTPVPRRRAGRSRGRRCPWGCRRIRFRARASPRACRGCSRPRAESAAPCRYRACRRRRVGSRRGWSSIAWSFWSVCW